jgi:hypothetical protein
MQGSTVIPRVGSRNKNPKGDEPYFLCFVLLVIIIPGLSVLQYVFLIHPDPALLKQQFVALKQKRIIYNVDDSNSTSYIRHEPTNRRLNDDCNSDSIAGLFPMLICVSSMLISQQMKEDTIQQTSCFNRVEGQSFAPQILHRCNYSVLTAWLADIAAPPVSASQSFHSPILPAHFFCSPRNQSHATSKQFVAPPRNGS